MKVSVVNPQAGCSSRGGNLKQKPVKFTFRGNSEPDTKPNEKGIFSLLKEHKIPILAGLGILAIFGGIGYYSMKKPEASKVSANSDGDTFKSQSQASAKTKNNFVITGASNKRAMKNQADEAEALSA